MPRWGLLVLIFGLAGCSTMEVASDYDPKADFSALRTYTWLPASKIKSGDPQVQYDSLLESRIRNAVDAQMREKGFELSERDTDFLVAYHVTIDKKTSVTYLNELYGYGPGRGTGYRRRMVHYGYPGPEVMVSEYNEGTLILDVVRADNKQLIWRGSATAEVYPELSPEARESRIQEAVGKILALFPPPDQ